MRWGTLSIVVAGLLLLAGCSTPYVANDLDEMMTTDVEPTTLPAFLDDAQSERDILPSEDLETTSIDPTSTRYEGRWEGWDVYLAVSGEYTVNLVSVDPTTHRVVSYGHGIGNSVTGTGEPLSLQYLPQGTTVVPEGWRALTEWIIVRD